MTTLTIDKQIDFGALGAVFAPSAYVKSWNRALTAGYIPHSASMASSVNNALDFLLSRGVAVEDTVVVEDFLTNYYGIVAYLYEVPEKVSHYFGKSGLKVGLFADPDSGDEGAEFYLEVETALSPEQANERLSKLNREWLFASSDKDLMSLNVTLKFI